MIVLDLSILNQKGTPMFNSDTFANRPNFGIVGRIFISTDTKEFYRDTGTSWELIGGPGSGTITGSGAATQVAFWNGTSTISGSNNLWWDATNNYFGINTNAPTTALDVHHSTNSGAIFNQTTATNNNTINFQTSGSGRWRIGNFYTAGADDFGVFDVIGNLQQFTIAKTTGQTFIGAKTTASGRLVVNSATADNHLQVVGANSPSIRIDNAGSGGTQRFVFGLATATNNFIQGATAGEFCISTQSAGNMLFGMWQTTNASEVMRISTANNLIVGSSLDTGDRFQVTGTSKFNGLLSTTPGNAISASGGSLLITPSSTRGVINIGGTTDNFLTLSSDGYIAAGSNYFQVNAQSGRSLSLVSDGNLVLSFAVGSTAASFIGNVGIGVSPVSIPNYKVLNIQGNSTSNGGLIQLQNSDNSVQAYWFSTGTNSTLKTLTNHELILGANNTDHLYLKPNGNLLLGSSVDTGQKLQVNGNVAIVGSYSGTSAFLTTTCSALVGKFGAAGNNAFLEVLGSTGEVFRADAAAGAYRIVVTQTGVNMQGKLNLAGLPTSPAGLVAGDVWNNLGILNIV